MPTRACIAIDLKSFYASVECVERGLDPLNTNLVVADESRTDKTICLAVTPALKSWGIPGRSRLFEVKRAVQVINEERKKRAPGHVLKGSSIYASEINANPSLAVDFIIAPPRMAYYMQYSTRIFGIYMRRVSSEDIHVYSIDEVFMEVGGYLRTYKMTAHELAMAMIRDVLKETGITATAGIGTNLYLAKIAMDIVAKKMPADKDGVRIAELDEIAYRKQLWNHRPLTDFWRIGKGIAKKLETNGLYTMGDVARCSLGTNTDYYNEELLFKLFGINAELVIDHAWGFEPCRIEDIKNYRPDGKSLSSGQVLSEPYDFQKTRLIIREMTDGLVLDLVEKGLTTDKMTLNINYDTENLANPASAARYAGLIERDFYGRLVPKGAHGSIDIAPRSSSSKHIIEAVMTLYDKIVDKGLTVRRMAIVAENVETETQTAERPTQLDMFTDYESVSQENDKEKRRQEALLRIRSKYGKNAIIRGMNLQEGATAISRNGQIGGHKA